jgi:hypothetical protein
MGVAQGKKVLSDGVAAQTIEAQPVFGQIEPSKRPRASRAEPQLREKMAGLGLTWQEFETIQRRRGSERRQKALSSSQGQPRANGFGATSMWARDAISAISSKSCEEGRNYLSQARPPLVRRAAVVDQSTGRWRWIIAYTSRL